MEQEVKYIALKDLVLWTENPRDPIDPTAKDQDVVDRALSDPNLKWSLDKLCAEMGEYYDLSELPTVVYHKKVPVVYDGNRRVVLGKIKFGLVEVPEATDLVIPTFPHSIPCNVCDETIALRNVLRKHSASGSWHPLERDMFLYKFMREKKSSFLILAESTGIIEANPYLNQRFVKEEIFRDDVLGSLGFTVQEGRLYSVHNQQESRAILTDIAKKIELKEISTRRNRGKVVEVLDQVSQEIIEKNKDKGVHLAKVRFSKKVTKNAPKITKRSPKQDAELFGGKLYLQIGEVSDLYRDIVDLYNFYIAHKNHLSPSFPSIFRVALRLLCETAAGGTTRKVESYVAKNFANAKKDLSQDVKTTLSNQNVKELSMMQLLHTGAHNYKASSNVDQTIALSVIIGAMLTISHGREE